MAKNINFSKENNLSLSTQQTEELSLKDVIKFTKLWIDYLISMWRFIVILGFIGALAGFFYAYQKKPLFTASTTFVLEDSDKGGSNLLGQYAGLASMAGLSVDGGGGIFQGDNIIELYKSSSMIRKTLLSKVDYNNAPILLIDRYITFNKLRDEWKKKTDTRNLSYTADQKVFSRLQDSVLNIVIGDIKKNYLGVSRPDKKLSIIDVDVTSEDEFFSKGFNDQIVKNVNDFYIQTKTKKSLQNLDVLQHQTDSVRGVLNGSINTAAAIVDATPNLNPTRQILRTSAQRSQFNAEANKAILTQLVQNLELAKITLRKETPLIQVIDAPVYPLKMEKLGKIKTAIIGGMLMGVVVSLILIIRKYLKTL